MEAEEPHLSAPRFRGYKKGDLEGFSDKPGNRTRLDHTIRPKEGAFLLSFDVVVPVSRVSGHPSRSPKQQSHNSG